jgi:endo-1,4-beta-mannosidase
MRNFKLQIAYFRAAVLVLVFAVFDPVFALSYTASGTQLINAQGEALKAVALNLPGLIAMDDKKAVEILEKAAKNGISIVRITAAYNGDSPFSFQPEPGKFNDDMFEKLDRMIQAAGKSGIRLVIALADSGNGNSSKKTYSAWAGGSNDDVFFKDRISMNLFKNFVKRIITRKNTATKIPYFADAAVFSWDLCNSAVNDNDPDKSVMYSWVAEMASYVKSLDKMHLVTINLEKQDFEASKINNYDIVMLPGVDYVTFTDNGTADIGAAVSGYSGNAGKPSAMIFNSIQPGLEKTAAEFITSGGSIIFFDNTLLENEKTAPELYAAANSVKKNTAVFKAPVADDTVGGITNESAEIKVATTGNTAVKITYGTEEPLKNEAEGPGTFKITGLKPGTKYFYRVKAILDGIGSVSSLKSFTTKTFVRLKAVPFTMSKNFITAKDGAFYDGSRKYRYVGANNYYIRHAARELCDEIFREAAAVGIKVIRIGSNGEAENMDSIDKRSVNRFFRIGPDYFNEAAYKEFDYVLDSAARHGIRVIIHFTDNWEYYGGVKVYTKWAGLSNKNLFWTDEKCKELYKQTVDSFLKRKNTVNGKMYKDDPAIFAFDLMNEPRNEDDQTSKTLASWVDEMSTYIKSVDKNHMVTTGMEGFFLKADGTHYSGSDFVLCQQPKNIDFCTFHIYPASQYNNFSPSTTAWMLDNYIRVAHETVKKPVVMEEYGIPNNNPDFPKAKWIADMTTGFFKAGGDGVNYWFFIDPTYFFGDGNEVNYKQTEYMNTFIKVGNELNIKGY